ncbi:Aldehyde/histidinol dehydrogenase [Gloeopeniophorella convolvens]|nr:Aldehyde/histidinol dehydrogenase [Gloeopeniophorella convolvens]
MASHSITAQIRESLQKGFASGKSKFVAYRKYLFLRVAYLLKDNDARLAKALSSDLGRPSHGSKFMEINTSLVGTLGAYKHVEHLTPMRPVVHKEANGVVLIIAPFNYPLLLIISSLLGAIAAGNAVCIKLSEQTPAISALMTELVGKYLDPAVVRVVNGAIPETARLLDIQWDYILLMGSGRVGKAVSQAAAKFMTPVTLELGGKSPVFVDSTCDPSTTTRRLLWEKFSNAGQTCTAPDYVLVLRSFQDKFVEAPLKT